MIYVDYEITIYSQAQIMYTYTVSSYSEEDLIEEYEDAIKNNTILKIEQTDGMKIIFNPVNIAKVEFKKIREYDDYQLKEFNNAD